MIPNPWPDLKIFARLDEEVDPFENRNAGLFRGEEAFSPEVEGWKRWSKPSPEPELDEAFQNILLASIAKEAKTIFHLVEKLADRVSLGLDQPPLLVAILRAGVPVGALLAKTLERRFQAPVPFTALSLFSGLGWDAEALAAILSEYPDRPVWFVDGWTSGGSVAKELQSSFQSWLTEGKEDFTHGSGPKLAVLCDPGGFAQASAVRRDLFIPSSCFTAPDTLGFSRGFATAGPGMLHVYHYPERHLRPETLAAWLSFEEEMISFSKQPEEPLEKHEPAPDGWRIHVNEVARALINRDPKEILLLSDRKEASIHLAPVLALCERRKIPVSFGREEVGAWGAIAAARMR